MNDTFWFLCIFAGILLMLAAGGLILWRVKYRYRVELVPAPSACPEGFHFIGQSLAHCDKCGNPASAHAGFARPSRQMKGPFDDVEWVLDPHPPGRAEVLRRKGY